MLLPSDCKSGIAAAATEGLKIAIVQDRRSNSLSRKTEACRGGYSFDGGDPDRVAARMIIAGSESVEILLCRTIEI